VTLIAVNPTELPTEDLTEVRNEIENKFARSKEEGACKKRVQKTRRRKDEKTKKTKDANEKKSDAALRYGFQKRRIENDTTHG